MISEDGLIEEGKWIQLISFADYAAVEMYKELKSPWVEPKEEDDD